MSIFDKVLLAVEVTGALVVAWLVWQYIYTAYIDTAPRRVSPPPRSGQVAGVAPRPAPSPAPTRVAEVAQPLTGAPDDEEWSTGPGKSLPKGRQTPGSAVSASHPTATPTVAPQLLLPSRLRIPVMFLDSPVHEVTVNMGEWEVSPMDIGHHEGTANPGETGNVEIEGNRENT
jgi:hypothetical protein